MSDDRELHEPRPDVVGTGRGERVDVRPISGGHRQVDTPNWSTKIQCSCGEEFTSRCEFWKHGYEALLAQLSISAVSGDDGLGLYPLCWQGADDGRIVACDRKAGHKGPHTWELVSQPEDEETP